MATILWTSYQEEHIGEKHDVSAEDFGDAWHDAGRKDLAAESHAEHGPYCRSIGATIDGRLVEMIWRWQDEEQRQEVWPITAYLLEENG